MSQPPEYPGRRRLKRAAAAAGSEAYQGAFEAVGSVLVACGIGYWIDSRWETAPYGVLIGAIVGFAAMVLRLVRLGRELHPDAGTGDSPDAAERGERIADDLGVGEALGVASVLREDRDEREGRGEGRSEGKGEGERPAGADETAKRTERREWPTRDGTGREQE